MIRNSFIFLEGIGRKKEMSLWKQGINDWDSFLKTDRIKGISTKRKQYYNLEIYKASKALLDNDSGYFCCFPSAEQWRAYNEFRDEALFLDIETCERNKEITVVGLSDGYSVRTMINGINLDKKLLISELEKAKILVTFNGKSFDIPLLEKYFGFKIQIPHVDLKHACMRAGIKGGLKDIERQLGIGRPDHLLPKGGDHAVDLWKAFKASGDKEYLELLVAYNAEDCVNLKKIAEVVYSHLCLG